MFSTQNRVLRIRHSQDRGKASGIYGNNEYLGKLMADQEVVKKQRMLKVVESLDLSHPERTLEIKKKKSFSMNGDNLV